MAIIDLPITRVTAYDANLQASEVIGVTDFLHTDDLYEIAGISGTELFVINYRMPVLKSQFNNVLFKMFER